MYVDPGVAVPTTQTLHVTGGTVVSNPSDNGIYSDTPVADHDVAFIIDAGVSVTALGGSGAIFVNNDTSGDVTVTSAATVSAAGTAAGISAITDLGSVSLINDGDVTSGGARGLYADGGYNNTDASPALVLLINNGTVHGYTAGARAINWHGLASLVNTGSVISDTRQGLVAWSNSGNVSIANLGSSIALDDNALTAFSEIGDIGVLNAGSLRAYNDISVADAGSGHNGIQTEVSTSGTTFIINTASGNILAPDDTAISAKALVAGDILIANDGTVSGKNGIAATTASGRVDITNWGSVTGTAGNGVILTGASLTNSGSITGSVYGVDLVGSGNTVTSSGRISGTTASVHFGAGGNTLNILQGSVFSGLVDYNATTGNTTSFGAGSYAIPASNYLDASNRIALNNSTQVVVLDHASSTGTINVVAIPAASQAATQYTASVSDVVGSVLSLDVARPDQVTVGEGTPSALLQYGETKPETKEAKALRQLGGGIAVDGYGNLFWARAFGGVRYQPDSNGDAASHTSHYGVISGVDHQFENYRLGFFGGAGSVKTETSGGASEITGDTGFLGVYGAIDLHGLQWNASLTGGFIDNETSRSINNGAETASGDFTGWYISPELAVSTAYAIAPQWELRPIAKLRYTGAFYDAYGESGSSQNVSYDNTSTHSLDGRLQVELKHTMVLPSGLPASIIATAALGDTQYLGSGDTHASLLNNEFTVSSSGDRNVVGATIGLGFDAMVSTRAAIYGGIDGTLYSDDSMSATGRLGMKVAF